MKKLYIPLLIALVTGVAACSDNADNCPDYWAVEQYDPTFIAEIDETNEALSLQITNYSGLAGEVFQSYFTGEFDAIANFENFTAPPATGTNGRGFIEMVMYNTNFPDTILDTTAIRVGLSSTHLYAGIGVVDYQEKARLSSATSGKLEIRKHGNNLTAIGIAGLDTVIITKNAPMEPVRFGFRIGSISDSTVTGTVGVKIMQFNVVGNNATTLYGDDFSCNSIYVP